MTQPPYGSYQPYGSYRLPPSAQLPPQQSTAPGELPRHRPHPVAYVFAVIAPLVLLTALALPAAVIVFGRTPATSDIPQGSTPTAGGNGVGDPYFSTYGNSGYDATKYTIAVSFDPSTQVLTGTTTVTARAVQTLQSFYLDLALATETVLVDGREATFERQGFAELEVVPVEPIPAGQDFDVTVTYSGEPAKLGTPGDRAPWSVTRQEWTVAGEPESSAWWFPANDHPSDPALMDVSVRIPDGLEALSVGRLESRDTADEADWNTWHWLSRQPMATYLNFLSIGQYEIRESVVDGRPAVYAVTEQLSPADRGKAFTAMDRTGPVIRGLETFFGPYPFSEVGGVVPAHRLGFGGLENQTRPVYAADAILADDFATNLVAHELSHMWFGDNVTLHEWNDVCINECWASWGDWAYSAANGGEPLNTHLRRVYDHYATEPDYWRVTLDDPGADNLFTVVYTRGPMMLQALKNRIGDEAFFAMARDWAQTPGSRSLEQWMDTVQSYTSIDLDPFFQAWIYGDTAPAPTTENGLP